MYSFLSHRQQYWHRAHGLHQDTGTMRSEEIDPRNAALSSFPRHAKPCYTGCWRTSPDQKLGFDGFWRLISAISSLKHFRTFFLRTLSSMSSFRDLT